MAQESSAAVRLDAMGRLCFSCACAARRGKICAGCAEQVLEAVRKWIEKEKA